MKKGKTLKTYITTSPRTHTAVSLKGEVNVKPLYLCTHTKRKEVVQQCQVVSAAVILALQGEKRKEELKTESIGLSFPFSCYHCTSGGRIPRDKTWEKHFHVPCFHAQHESIKP